MHQTSAIDESSAQDRGESQNRDENHQGPPSSPSRHYAACGEFILDLLANCRSLRREDTESVRSSLAKRTPVLPFCWGSERRRSIHPEGSTVAISRLSNSAVVGPWGKFCRTFRPAVCPDRFQRGSANRPDWLPVRPHCWHHEQRDLQSRCGGQLLIARKAGRAFVVRTWFALLSIRCAQEWGSQSTSLNSSRSPGPRPADVVKSLNRFPRAPINDNCHYSTACPPALLTPYRSHYQNRPRNPFILLKAVIPARITFYRAVRVHLQNNWSRLDPAVLPRQRNSGGVWCVFVTYSFHEGVLKA